LEVKNVRAGDDGRVKGSSFLDVFRHSGKLLSHALTAGIKKKKKSWIILFYGEISWHCRFNTDQPINGSVKTEIMIKS
jgi:hypothetical protein